MTSTFEDVRVMLPLILLLFGNCILRVEEAFIKDETW